MAIIVCGEYHYKINVNTLGINPFRCEKDEMITISDAAQAHFQKLLSEQEEENVNIRVFVSNPGTPQAECGVSFCPESAVERDDVTLKFKDFFAYVDSRSAPYLDDAEIDFQEEQMGAQLTLKAPNAKARKVADDAPLEDRVRYLLESEINPQLANHGGQVTLVEIAEQSIAVLQFGGGCQGCGMVDVTLKEGIEKSMLEAIPEITAVRDVTEHGSGENPYY